MRRFERMISLLAVIGVLLHAGLLVRHNGVMLDGAMDRIALDFAGGVICHGGGEDTQPNSGMPAPSSKLPNCPVCVGTAAAAAILPPLIALPGNSLTFPIRIARADQQTGKRAVDFRPPSRAPPQTS